MSIVNPSITRNQLSRTLKTNVRNFCLFVCGPLSRTNREVVQKNSQAFKACRKFFPKAAIFVFGALFQNRYDNSSVVGIPLQSRLTSTATPTPTPTSATKGVSASSVLCSSLLSVHSSPPPCIKNFFFNVKVKTYNICRVSKSQMRLSIFFDGTSV